MKKTKPVILNLGYEYSGGYEEFVWDMQNL